MSTRAKTEREKPIEVAVDPRLSRGVKAFLKVLNSSGGPPLETLPPLEAREVLVNAQASVPVDLSGIEESEKTIAADGYTIKLNVVRPEGVKGKLPVFIFIHGGGWVLGDYPTHKRMVRDLVVLTGFAGVFVNYTRTPDARYPQAINEIYAATRWVAEHGAEIDVDGKNLAVVGNSVGGNMTAVTALKAKEQGGPNIKLHIMMWPVTDANFETESYKQFGEKRFLTTPLMKWMLDLYTTDPNATQGNLRIALAGNGRAIEGIASGADTGRGKRHPARRGRGVRAQARRGWSQSHDGALRRHDPRFRLAERVSGRAGGSFSV